MGTAATAIEFRGMVSLEGDAPEIGEQVAVTVTGQVVGHHDVTDAQGVVRRVAIVLPERVPSVMLDAEVRG